MAIGFNRAAAMIAVACGVAAGIVGVASWQTSASAESRTLAAQRTATIDLYGLMERLIDSDKYKPAREAHHNELKTKLDAFQKELEATQTALRAMDQSKPEFQGEYVKFQGRVQEFQKLQEESVAKAEEFNTVQLLESYKLVTEAAASMAKERGYTTVIATRSMDKPIDAKNLQGALQEILARPVVYSAPEDDLTDALATSMKLPAPKVEAPAAAPTAAPAQPEPAKPEEPKK